MSNIELLVNGSRYGGWTDIAVKRSMEAVSGAFDISLTERWAGQSKPWQIPAGSECAIFIDGGQMITGYTDSIDASFDSGSHTVSIKGRDKTADMVDCSAVHSPDQWSNIKLDKLAAILAAPFGVTVRCDIDIGAAFTTVKLDHGETAYEALERHARQRAALLLPDRSGGLIITHPGSQRASVKLEQGVNVLSANGGIDFSSRFSDYIIKGQSPGNADTDPDLSAHIEATTSDSRIKRYRPLIVQAEALQDNGSAKDRAAWELNVRRGRSAKATVTVQDWRQMPGGDLWDINMLVRVHLPWLQINGEMMISSVTFKKSNGGTLTDLEIASPEAFQPDITSEKPRKRKEKENDEDWDSW